MWTEQRLAASVSAHDPFRDMWIRQVDPDGISVTRSHQMRSRRLPSISSSAAGSCCRGAQPAPGALGITGGRVAAVAERERRCAAEAELDVGDALVLPGAVDAHVHTGSAAGGGDRTLHPGRRRRGRHHRGRHALRRPRHGRATPMRSRRRRRWSSARRTSTSRCGRRCRRTGRSTRSSRCSTPGPSASSSPPSTPTRCASRACPTTSSRRPSRAIGAAGGLAALHSENDELVRARIAALREAGRRTRRPTPSPARRPRRPRRSPPASSSRAAPASGCTSAT